MAPQKHRKNRNDQGAGPTEDCPRAIHQLEVDWFLAAEALSPECSPELTGIAGSELSSYW